MRYRNISLCVVLGGLALLPPELMAAKAEKPTQGITIIGDQELPQVLYIVPWKSPQPVKPAYPDLEDPTLSPLTPCDLLPAERRAVTDNWSCNP